MKFLFLFFYALTQADVWSAVAEAGDAYDHVAMEFLPEGVRWLEVGFFWITPDNFTTVHATYNNFKDPVVFLSMPQVEGEKDLK